MFPDLSNWFHECVHPVRITELVCVLFSMYSMLQFKGFFVFVFVSDTQIVKTERLKPI